MQYIAFHTINNEFKISLISLLSTAELLINVIKKQVSWTEKKSNEQILGWLGRKDVCLKLQPRGGKPGLFMC